MSRKLNVLVVGAGMYVWGRGTEGYGTILPTLHQTHQKGILGQVTICATREKSATTLQQKHEQLCGLFGHRFEIETLTWDRGIVFRKPSPPKSLIAPLSAFPTTFTLK